MMIAWFAALVLLPLGLWLVWSGWTNGVGIQIGIGATLIFVAVVLLGATYLATRLKRVRERKEQMDASGSAAGLPFAGLPGDGGKKPGKTSSDSPSDKLDLDGDGLDV